MTPPIFQVTSADPGAHDALWWGSPPAYLGDPHLRLYPFGDAPDGVALPYAVWQLVSGSPENYLAGRPDADGYGLQIDVYAGSAASAREVATAIQHAIELDAHIVGYNGESRDAETQHYRVGFDVDWIVRR